MLHERLKNSRMCARLTQHDLAEISKLSLSSICLFEKGTRLPSADSITKICEALKVSADYLLGVKPQKGDDEIQYILKTYSLLDFKDRRKVIDFLSGVKNGFC